LDDYSVEELALVGDTGGSNMNMLRRGLLATVTFLAATALVVGTGPAGAAIPPQGKIAPHQFFVGLVNGNSGIGHHAQIRVACPGPIRRGETTHPLPHQPLEVVRPAAILTNDGYTGAHGTHVNAYLGIPPSATTSGGIATFAYYGVKKAIPTTLNVPCSGTGYITFVPLPRDPGSSRAFVVPVDFVNIAV
jgi:hypothetical protein